MRKARTLGSQPKTSRSELQGSPLKGFPATPALVRQTDGRTSRQADKQAHAHMLVPEQPWDSIPDLHPHPYFLEADMHTCSVTEHHPHSACAVLMAGTTGDSCQFQTGTKEDIQETTKLSFSQRGWERRRVRSYGR